jgi:hypothetical protein
MVNLKVTAIKPPKMPTGEAYAQAMQVAVQKAAGLVLRDLESTVRTWTTKPAFDVTITEQRGDYSVIAGTDNKIYGYVNDGTKPHDIKPKRSKYLRYSSGFKAKTRIGIIGSVEGGSFGNDIFSKGVHHPGFIGRGFTKKIAQRRQVTVRQEVDAAIAKINAQKAK